MRRAGRTGAVAWMPVLAALPAFAADPPAASPDATPESLPVATAPDRATARPDPCADALAVPKVIGVAPVELPASLWARRATLTARVGFGVDEDGRASRLSTTATGVPDDERPAFVDAVERAFGRFRFCRPVAYASERRWRVSLQFSPMLRGVEGDRHAFYMQMLVPGYVGFERYGVHSGAVTAGGVYAADGHPRSVDLVQASGDRVLDDKSLDAMATAVLIFPTADAPSQPIRIARRFVYRHRAPTLSLTDPTTT